MGYYALGEQRSGDVSLDMLTLHAETAPPHRTSETAPDDMGMITVAEQPPKVTLALEAATDAAFYIARRPTLVIYHAIGDRIVALIELLSSGNKHSRHTVDDFLDTVIAALRQGYHVLVIDLFPPGRCDPSGRHGVIWEYLWDINDKTRRNKVRYINHSCDPSRAVHLSTRTIWIVTLQDITAGEELTYNYDYKLDDDPEHPCTCRAEHCCRYILAPQYWGLLQHKYAQASQRIA